MDESPEPTPMRYPSAAQPSGLGALPNRQFRVRLFVGVAVGTLIPLLILLPAVLGNDYFAVVYLTFLAVAATGLTGAVLTIWKAIRAFGLGMLIGGFVSFGIVLLIATVAN